MNESNYSRRAPPALILSSDALGAALIGAALELRGYRPTFPRDAESSAEAVRRLRPRALLVDARDDSVNDAVLGPAMMTDARIVLFGPSVRLTDLRVLATKYGAALLALPEDVDALPTILTQASPLPRRTRRD